MRRVFLGLSLFILWVVPRTGEGQAVSVRARVDSTSYAVGDAITVHLDVAHPKGASLKMAVGDSLDGFSVLDRSPFVARDETSSSASLVVAKYDSGSAVLPPLEVLYMVPGDSALHSVTTNPLQLTIHTLAVDTSQAYRDVKPPLSIPLTVAEIALFLGIVLVIAALAYYGYRWWKRRQQKITGEVYVPPPRPAHIIALEELAILKEKRLWQRGLIKQYYSEFSEILRRYVENRYGLMALEQTTDEIMSGLKRREVKPLACSKVETLLQLSDLVKFAKYQPGISEHEEVLTMAYDIVQTTKPVDMKPAEQSAPEAAVHVGS